MNSFVQETLEQVQNQLDKRNEEALLELNRQIDTYDHELSPIHRHRDSSYYDALQHQLTQDTEALFARVDLSEDASPYTSPPQKKQDLESLFQRLKKSRSDLPLKESKLTDEHLNEIFQRINKKDEDLLEKDSLEFKKQNSATFSDTDPYKHLTGVPSDSNSRAVVNALRTLQERVGKLESERIAAKEKIQDLEKELSSTRKLLFHQQQKEPLEADETLQRIAEAREQVNKLQERVEQVQESIPQTTQQQRDEKYVESVQRLSKSLNEPLYSALPFTVSADHKTQAFSSERSRQLSSDVRYHAGLSPETKKLLLPETQKLLEESFKPQDQVQFEKPADLKSSLRDSPKKEQTVREQAVRERSVTDSPAMNVLHELSQQLDSALHDTERKPVTFKTKSQLLQEEIDRERKKNPLDQKQDVKEKLVERIKSNLDRTPSWETFHKQKPKSRSTSHVRKRQLPEMDLKEPTRDMPFVVGSNTGKSFSVTANLQTVFSMLKNHNADLCQACSSKKKGLKHDASCKKEDRKDEKREQKKETSEEPQKDSEGLRGILSVLEDEFRKLKVQYHTLVAEYERVAESMTKRSISESDGNKSLKQIGDSLRLVIQNMETKGDQIAILRDIVTSSIVHEQNHLLPRKAKTVKQKHYQAPTVTSNKKTSLKSPQRPKSASATLTLLKSTQKVQKALQ
ncbi:hypothetical protein EDD86DRAFT_204452, partial [Gorgonomyces haynaldii]